MSNILRLFLFLLLIPTAQAQIATDDESPSVGAPLGAPVITDIRVTGNAKVEPDAIVTLLNSRKGDPLDPKVVQDDIRSLYELGYFSDIRIYKEQVGSGVELIVQVVEKPAIVKISFKGLDEITEEDLQDKLETRLYTIVNEATITSDVRMIEQQYAEKGFYLARVTYTLEADGKSEVALTFHVDEGGIVHVGDVSILGNEYYSDIDLMKMGIGFAALPHTRSENFGSGSIYQEERVKRDLEFMAFIYRDQGFAEVKVGKPFQMLDSDREFVRVTYQVEEGLQYNVEGYDITGDLLFEKEELFDEMRLKPGELFRYSRFSRDIEMLVDKYGDLGYAFADVNPKVKFNREKRTVFINYEITKGEKVYFGKMTVVGNIKTRDNVVRREFEVADSELYSGTGLATTKRNINRLGFFEEVQVIKERDEVQQDLMNLKVKVKEKPTGQLQAAIGFTPANSGTQGSQWTGTGRYEEQNQSGKGWRTNLSGRWNGEENFDLNAGFTDPRVNDSIWSAGVNAFYSNQKRKDVSEVVVEETKTGGSIFVGRKIIELLRGRLTYSLTDVSRRAENNAFLIERFREEGISSSMTFSLIRRDVDNYVDPTDGSDVVVRQKFTGGPVLQGDFQYMESELDASYFYPIDFTETFRTYFKFHTVLAHIYPMGDKPVPFLERYRLGGPNDLRGYDYWEIGPAFYMLQAPGGTRERVNKGGDKKLIMQLEYFMPLIPQAGIKTLVFADAGRVYDDAEPLAWGDFTKDVGFGFRWITPIAPFRFEWAYPIEEDGSLGDMEIIFYIGY